MYSHNDREYIVDELKDVPAGDFCSLPVMMDTRKAKVLFTEAPLQMMCESPTIYYNEQESVDFITQIPTVWDDAIVLQAAVADYIVVARRHGEDWYLGAMTDWDARDFDIDLSFLGSGTYQIQFMQDGINADRNATDYKLATKKWIKTVSLKSS